MAPKLPTEFRFGGGLNLVDAPDFLVAQGQLRQAENFRIPGHGWISTRKAALEIVDTGVWTVVAIFPFNHQASVSAVLLEWNRFTGMIRLATVNGSGLNHTVIGDLRGYDAGELVGEVDTLVDPGFGSPAEWTGSGWEVSGGTAGLETPGGGGVGSLSPVDDIVCAPGQSYRVTYTVTGRTQGDVTVTLGTDVGTTRSTNGTFQETLIPTSPGGLSWVADVSGDFDGRIDNVVFEYLGTLVGPPEFTGAVLGRALFMADVARERGLVIYDPANALGGATMIAPLGGPSSLPDPGDVIEGATSGATATVAEAATLWHGSYVWVTGITGTFQIGESLDIQGGASGFALLGDAFASTPNIYQPTFDFNQDSVFDVAKPRIVLSHENHLQMFGYGDESDPLRGELLRFSYLGLIDDGQGSGDAGDGGRLGSTNLFDVDDFVPVGPIGSNVISAASAPGRLGYATENQFAVIYGTDRDTWRKDVLDTERGSIATRGMGEGDGVLWWYSPLGPAQYIGGGQALDLSRPIDPRTEEIDFSSLFMVHHPQENQVRWYYRKRGDTVAGADRWTGFNYLHRAYEEDVLGYRVFCAGFLLPAGTEGPAAAPSSLTHEAVTENAARARWVPGDTSPGVLTRVYRAPDVTGSPGTYVQLIELGPGATEYTHVGLEADTSYWTKVEHYRNGQVSNDVEGSFTTNAAAVIPVPLNVQARDFPVLLDTWQPTVLLSFDVGGVSSHSLYHRIERKQGAGAYAEIARVGIGDTSYRDWGVTAGPTFTYRVRAEDSETGALSDYSAEDSVVPTKRSFDNYPPDKGWV